MELPEEMEETEETEETEPMAFLKTYIWLQATILLRR